MTFKKDQHSKMTETNVYLLLFQLATPSIVGMAVTSLYSLADSFFVSKLGTTASAAVGVAFPIHALIQAMGYTLGMGAGSLVSRKMGEKKIPDAGKYASTAFRLSILFGLILSATGLLFSHYIIIILGASEAVYPYAMSYVRYLFLSAPFMCATLVVSQLLRSEGKAIYSMMGLLIGSLLNIALDPLFISTLHIGIAGASLATLISQIASLAFLLYAGRSKRSQLSFFGKISRKDIGNILTTGLPSTFRQGLIVLSTILLNHASSTWGDAAVASVSIVSRIFLIAFSVCLGIGQGMMPIIGYNYGCGKLDRARKAFVCAVLSSSAIMFLISIPLANRSYEVISFFRSDANVVAIGSAALRAQCIVFFTHGTATCTIMMLQAIGRKFSSTLLACARQGIFFVPLFFLLLGIWGVHAILYIQPIADALTFLAAIPLAIFALKLLSQKSLAKI